MSEVSEHSIDWSTKKLQDVCEITSSKRIFQSDYINNGIPFYRTKEVKELSEGKQISIELFISEEKYDQIKSRFGIPQKGDLLVSAVGTIGVSYIINDDKPFYFKDGNLVWLKNLLGVESKFLKYYLDHFVRFKNSIETSGSAYNALTIVKLKNFSIPVPSLKVQQQIVSKIEELFSELDKSIEQLKTVQQQLKVYRQSVLDRAFEDVDGPVVTLEQICESGRGISYGVIKLGVHVTDGTPCLRTSDVKPLGFDLSSVKKISSQLSNEYKRTVLKGGEVLVNIRGTLGGVAVVPKEMKGWNVSREIAVVPLKDEVNSDFIAYQIASPRSQSLLKHVTKGIAYQGINLGELRKIELKIPTGKVQFRVVEELEQQLSMVDKLEETISNSLQQAETLRQSVLKNAFKGQL